MPAPTDARQTVCVVLEIPATGDIAAVEIHIYILDPTGDYFTELDKLLPSNTPFSDLVEVFVKWVEDRQPEETRVTTSIQNFTFTSVEFVGFLSGYVFPGLRVNTKDVVQPWFDE